ncbi:uncharacterized [Tachysurus ichikawai]
MFASSVLISALIRAWRQKVAWRCWCPRATVMETTRSSPHTHTRVITKKKKSNRDRVSPSSPSGCVCSVWMHRLVLRHALHATDSGEGTGSAHPWFHPTRSDARHETSAHHHTVYTEGHPQTSQSVLSHDKAASRLILHVSGLVQLIVGHLRLKGIRKNKQPQVEDYHT